MEHKIPDEAGTRLKTYVVNSVFDGTTRQGAYWQSNPSMVFGSFVDSVLAWYPYSGDETAVSTVSGMLDCLLAARTDSDERRAHHRPRGRAPTAHG